MIDQGVAYRIAENYISIMQTRMGMTLTLLEEYTRKEEFGWVFFYESAEYLRTGNWMAQLAGNAPFIVDSENGAIYVTGSAHPINHYIEVYTKYRHQPGEFDKNKWSQPA